ncbi:putative surface protein with fasciclin (FAS1) repeats [Pacificibacter maritimus]|uniref:Putative surface protein with fasciclin (FAS1) repeats n=1 Tax=Pacificibacter maritimus TaxID=762213 RepID=A0A3N4UN08_9RHOB|nr:fasciclin domain-containing protein [Pacificibacter maritimus]RPE66437.1 putative surface protein with fasciclin (FAS1) repeats [Pacificibacter maritimus]
MKLTFTKTVLHTLNAAAFAGLLATAAHADNPMVGGAAMFEEKNIVENAVNSADHTTLVAAVQAAGLVDTLASPGPFTVFAPVNAGFEALPEGTVETLLKPENKDMLTKILTSHVVAGKWSAADIVKAARNSSDGFYHFEAVSGDNLSAQVKGKNVYIYDESGNASLVTIADVNQSNGVIHVINKVLLPK